MGGSGRGLGRSSNPRVSADDWDAQGLAGHVGHVNKDKGRANPLEALGLMEEEFFHRGRSLPKSEARVQRSGYEVWVGWVHLAEETGDNSGDRLMMMHHQNSSGSRLDAPATGDIVYH
jgi:hypothetical protein